jgi:hypothetical protein
VEERLAVTESALLQQKGNFGRLLSGVEMAVPKFVYRRQGFAHPKNPKNQDIFRVLFVGRSLDHWQRLKLIALAERFESAVCFELWLRNSGGLVSSDCPD